MSQQHFSEPPSILARRKDGDGPKKQTREEYRKQKELEEQRKAGTAPAEVDESGRDINPHIPKYMVDTPWYVTYDHSKPTLKHQRVHKEKERTFDGMDKWYDRGSVGKLATKFRDGACENCGAMGHKKKDCLERPRKIGAKFNNQIIAPDEVVQPDINLTFDGKRDRWNGVDLEWYQDKVKSEFEKLAEAKRLLKAKKLQESIEPETSNEANAEVNGGSNEKQQDSDVDNDEDEDKYADEADMPGQKVQIESKQRITVRNLRMREDTAKYLLNLDPNSAYYDPKSRSMRDNPFTGTSKNSSEVPYIGDNFVRYSGEANRFAKSQMFAWEASDKGVEVHQQAEPTKLELLHQEFKKRHEEYAKNIKSNVLEKYGGAEYLDAPPKELIFAQTENYIEYNRYGNIVKTQEKASVKSKYVEDSFINNHKSIWGSYWKDGKWGYKCCKSFDRNSYCEGSIQISLTRRFESTQTQQQQVKAVETAESHKSSQNSTNNPNVYVGPFLKHIVKTFGRVKYNSAKDVPDHLPQNTIIYIKDQARAKISIGFIGLTVLGSLIIAFIGKSHRHAGHHRIDDTMKERMSYSKTHQEIAANVKFNK